MSFEQLKYQFRDQWQAVEEDDDGISQRIKILELADMLIDWEIEQGEIKPPRMAKKRAAHWNSICQNMAGESANVVKGLDEKLADFKAKIEVAAEQNAQLSERIAGLMADHGVKNQDLQIINDNIDRSKGQLSALQELTALKDQIGGMEDKLAISIANIEQGGDPYDALNMLEKLWQLHSNTMAYYHEYHQVNQHIQNQMTGQNNPELQASAVKLLVDVGGKLKQVDELLSRQLANQDGVDQTVRERE